VRDDGLAVAVAAGAELVVECGQPRRPCASVGGGHAQPLAALGGAARERKQQRMSPPTQQRIRGVWSETRGREGDRPAFRLCECAGLRADPDDLTGCDDVQVAHVHRPVPVAEPQRSSASLEVGEHEEVV
jgi:hypothetical protein